MRTTRLLPPAILVCLAATGCMSQPSARLWADTGGAGGFSYEKRQYAYDGQPVTFELECVPSKNLYAVFGTGSQDAVVNTPTSAGRYRWTHAFAGGIKPTAYEVYATAFEVRDRCDWVYNKLKDTWECYPGSNDKPDVKAALDLVVEIRCYRVQVRVKFPGRAGPPREVALALVKPSGESVRIPRRRGVAADSPGFILLGPDNDGAYEVSYAPTFKEVGRGGKTRAEVVIEHSGGAVERLVQELDTP